MNSIAFQSGAFQTVGFAFMTTVSSAGGVVYPPGSGATLGPGGELLTNPGMVCSVGTMMVRL